MGSDYSTYSFAELLSNIVDNRGKTCPVDEDGLPLIATNCVKNNTLYPVFEKVRYVNKETYDTWFRGHPEPGDMIFVCKGSPGNVCWTPDPVNFCIAQDMVAIRANEEIVDPKYLFALLRSPSTQARILNMHVGTLIPHFKKGDFKNLYFDIPNDKDIQKAIGEIYFRFSEKIELNRRMNQTLEGIAQAIFKSWFVDFDPVRAKAAGQQLPGLASYIADLFPDAFEASELGKIPREWKYRSLYSCAQYINGAAFRSSDFSPDWSGLPIIKIAELKKGITAKTKFTSKELKSKYLLNNGDILFSWSGSPKTSLDVFLWSGGPAWLNQHIFRVIPNRSIERSFIYSLLRYLKPTFIEIARNKQTTGLGHVTMRDMKDLQVVLPPDEILEAFHRIAGPLLDRVYCNMVESHTLTQLRDTLLPKLISGELRVPDAERFLTEVSS